MKKLLIWISKHKKIIMLFCCALVLFPIAIIHILFKIKTNFYWLQAEWKAGDILSYWGDVLSFIGTVVLGYIAISQTEQANKLSAELLGIEKNKLKPRLDVSCEQLYKIYFSDNIYKQFAAKKQPERMTMEILYTSNPRSGLSTDIALIELEVVNRSGSDISKIYIQRINFYLCINEPYNQNEKVAIITGNTNINIGEKRTLYIYVRREINDVSEASDKWYEEHITNIMPHMEFDLVLETVSGERYLEKIICSTSWDATMQSHDNLAVRQLSVSPIEITDILHKKN